MRATMILACVALLGSAFGVAVSPAYALTAKEKMATCKFGADDQKLQGKARNAFLSKCMANEKVARPPSSPKPAPKPAT